MHELRPSIVVALVIAFVTAGLVAACGDGDDASPPTAAAAAAAPAAPAAAEPTAMAKDAMAKDKDAMAKDAMMKALPNKITAPHFIDSYPNHGDSLVQSPPEVVINVNFNLHEDSNIEVTVDGQPVSIGAITIAEDQLSLRAPLQGDGADGVYQVSYHTCWPDRSCHDGSVAFIVDGATIGEYQDLRGQSEVTIHMKDGVSFDPARILISAGTTVTWVNDDATVHFVNTDPHPSHNVLPNLNSSALRQGESYSYTFADAGAWGYHCSAHQNVGMVAQAVVE